MKVIRSLGEVTRDMSSVVTVGTFDGVHLAHQEIIREVVDRARLKDGRSVVITFDPHPKEVVASPRGPVELLSTVNERIELLGQMEIDLLFIIPFTFEFSRLTAGEFYRQYVVNGTGVNEVVVGYDHMFGRDRQAGIDELVHLGKSLNFSVFALHPYSVDGETVSSTRIRRALASGDVARAKMLLGRPYSLQSRVVPGDGRGKAFGYPTANLRIDSEHKLVPGNGVYVAGVKHQGRDYFGMMNIGVRPTVTDSGARTIEVHIFNFERDIYGDELLVSFLHWLREERRFSSAGELVDQLHRDREDSLKLLAERLQRN